jgi:hypothetical protein
MGCCCTGTNNGRMLDTFIYTTRNYQPLVFS